MSGASSITGIAVSTSSGLSGMPSASRSASGIRWCAWSLTRSAEARGRNLFGLGLGLDLGLGCRLRRRLIGVLVDDDHAQRLAPGDTDRLALFRGPGPDPVLEALGMTDLGGVGLERLDLPVDRRRHVDVRVRRVRPEQVE